MVKLYVKISLTMQYAVPYTFPNVIIVKYKANLSTSHCVDLRQLYLVTLLIRLYIHCVSACVCALIISILCVRCVNIWEYLQDNIPLNVRNQLRNT